MHRYDSANQLVGQALRAGGPGEVSAALEAVTVWLRWVVGGAVGCKDGMMDGWMGVGME